MKTFVSTKTFAVMCLLAGQIMTVRLEEGFTRQCSTLRCFVVSLLHHSLLQYFREETRDACIAAGRLDPQLVRGHPARDQVPDLDGGLLQGVQVEEGGIPLLADGGLDQLSTKAWPDGRSPSLRRLLIDMIEEYARHVGHADLIRESVDGLVGEDPED